MRRVRPLIAALLVVLMGIAGSASGYFSSSGSGTSHANIGTLSAPSISSATPGAGTVTLNWGSVTAPGAGTVRYYVTRDGGPAAGNCPSSTSPATTTTCTDSGLSLATHTYRVVAVWQSWTATSSASAVTVSFGALDHFLVSAPASATAGGALSVAVTAKDASGNTVTSYTGTVHLSSTDSQASIPPDYSFTAADAGSHTFSSAVTLKTAGAQTLSANDTSQTSATGTSGSISVSAAAPSKLVFTVSPGGAITGGTAFGTQPSVAAQDAYGNVTTGYASTVSLSIKAGTGATGASLSGCSSTETAGVTTFSGCKIDKAGTGYQLTAADGSLASGTSSSFAVTVGAAAKLVFTTQPGGATAGTAFATQPVVSAQDAGGNTVPTYAGTITLSLLNPQGATLSGCSSSRTSGVTTFSGCKINNGGNGYQLRASDGSLTVDSTTFTVIGSAAKLVFTTSPGGTMTGGVAFPTQPVVTVEDVNGNVVTNDASTVSLAIAAGTPTSGGPGTISGCSQTESSGVVTFSGCKINTAGTGYKLTATDGTLTSATSTAFDVAVGSISQFVLSSSTGSMAAGSTANLTITAKDAGGNTVTGYAGTHRLTFSGANIAPDGTHAPTVTDNTGAAIAFGTRTSMTFNSGVASVSSSSNGVMALYKAETASIAVTDGSATSNAVSVTVSGPLTPTGLQYADGNSNAGDAVTGSTSANASLTATETVGDHVGNTYSASAAANGTFSITVENYSAHSNQNFTYSVAAKDAYGNQSTAATVSALDSK
jgi:trimeric autotransporter adhesin